MSHFLGSPLRILSRGDFPEIDSLRSLRSLGVMARAWRKAVFLPSTKPGRHGHCGSEAGSRGVVDRGNSYGGYAVKPCQRCGAPFSPWRPTDRICWECQTAPALPAAPAPPPPQEPPLPSAPSQNLEPAIPIGRREVAVVWLAEQLAEAPVDNLEVARRAQEAGISPRTLRRAKKVLDVRSVRVGGLARAGFWVWVFPPEGNSGN